MDIVDRKTRSWIMSRVVSRGTKPEIAVCASFRQAGFRFSTGGDDLPGRPDFVFRGIKLAVFVNGCFWHWHGCRRCRMPKTNRAYWKQKVEHNLARDRKARRNLTALGWHYATIWECSLGVGTNRVISRIRALRD